MTVFASTGPSGHFDDTPIMLDLRLIQTTDLHAHILTYDYLSDRASDRSGLSRLAALIRRARNEVSNSLLLDTGDFLQGSPLGDVFASASLTSHDPPHPVIAVMNTLGYDAGTLGNHDFNYGLDFLVSALAKADFAMVCANISLPASLAKAAPTTLIAPWTILRRQVLDRAGGCHDLGIGVIGLLPPQIESWDRQHLEGRLKSHDIVSVARTCLPQMRAAGADLIVVLSHSGIAPDLGEHRMENAALALAALPGVDAILCGHQHQLFPGTAFAEIPGVDAQAGTLHGKPAVMAGFWGSHLGLIDLTLRRDAGGWTVCDHASHLRRSDDTTAVAVPEQATAPDDAKVLDLMHSAHARTVAHMRRPVGHSSRPIHSFFALVADDPSIQLVAEAQRDRIETQLRNRPEGRLPLLSAVSPFKAGGSAGPAHYTDIPAGPLRFSNLADLYQFPNLLGAVHVTGTALFDWLEHAAGQFNHIRPGEQDQMLLDPRFPSYNFDVICGLRYVIDPTKRARFTPDGRRTDVDTRRVSNVTFSGVPVKPDQRFIVATNSYRAGRGGFAASVRMKDVQLPEKARIDTVLAEYVSGRRSIDPLTRPVWRFAPCPGTSVLFDSAPAAAEVLDDLEGMRIEKAGPAPDGFMRFRLYL